MRRLATAVGQFAEWVDEAARGIVRVGPFVVMRQSEQIRRARSAFELGVDAGRLGYRTDPEPAPVRHLHAVER